MDIKIPKGPGPSSEISEVDGATAEALPAQGVSAAAPTGAADAVAQIAQQVAAGQLSRDEAIAKLLDEAVSGAPTSLLPENARTELLEMLQALVDTNPELRALADMLGPSVKGE